MQRPAKKPRRRWEASVEDIEYRDGTLTVVGTDKHVSLFDLAKQEEGARLSVNSEGQTDGPSWPNGTHICEVEIDPETGVTRVVRYTTVDDVGVAINPMLVTGQVHGGVAQGIGQALYEGVTYSSEGQLITASYQDYCLPRADDVPPIEVTLDGSAPCRTNPLGAKGLRRVRRDRRAALHRQRRDGCAFRSRHHLDPDPDLADEDLGSDPRRQGQGGVNDR